MQIYEDENSRFNMSIFTRTSYSKTFKEDFVLLDATPP